MARIEDLSPKTRARLAELMADVIAKETPAPAPATYVEPEPQELSEDAISTANQVIKDLLEAGHGDYTAQREDIARVMDDDIWNGNWDATLEGTDGRADLRFIQEDEYDQSMDEDDKPEWDAMLASGSGFYVFPS